MPSPVCTNRPLAPLDPASPELRSDPYPVYHRYRARDPVHRGLGRDPQGPGCWYLTRYTDVANALMDPALVQSRVLAPNEVPPFLSRFCPLLGTLHDWMVVRVPSSHTRLRSAVSRALTLSVPRALEEEIEQLAGELLDGGGERGTIDAIGEYASPLTVITISRILGAPRDDWRLFRRWSKCFARAMDLHPSASVFGEATQAAVDSSAYLRDLLVERRRKPGSDLISRLASEGEGGSLSEDELISNCILLLFAGHETTVNLIGNAVLALWRHREKLEELKRSLDLMPRAVDELLRFDSPIQMLFRVASDDLELGGQSVARGDLVSLVVGAANRDPAQFPEPDRLDLARGGTSQLSFGRGTHSCLGAGLARTEAGIAIKTLLRRAPGFEVRTDALEWRTDNVTLRGLRRLPLFLGPRSPGAAIGS